MATYYVSATGNDTNNGTATTTPWKTITKVNATTLSPGDAVYFNGGDTFTGNLAITNSGTLANPILIGSYGIGKATISCGDGTGILLTDCEYVHISNLTIIGATINISGATSSTTNTGSGIEVKTTATQATIAAWKKGIYIDSVTVSGCYHGINCHSYGGSATTPFPVGFDDLRITNCTISSGMQVGIHVWSNNSTSGNYFGIENGTGDIAYHKNVYIGNCYVSNVYGDSAVGVLWTGSGIVVGNCNVGLTEKCLVTNCGQADGSAVPGGPGGNWLYDCKSYIIQYCETSHMHDPKGQDAVGFDIDGGCSDCILQYNYSHDNDGTGYIYGEYGVRGTTRSIIRYNISQNNGKTIAESGIRSFGVPTSTKVYNNVFYCDTPGTTPYLISTVPDASFYNNIFWCGSGVGLFNNVGAQTFNGNLYWFGGGSFSLTYGGVTYTSLASWRTATSLEKVGARNTGLFADPLFTSPGGGGTLLPSSQTTTLTAYDLIPGSPAIDAGLDLLSLFSIDPGTLDFHGRSNRSGNGFDIGACEAVSSGAYFTTTRRSGSNSYYTRT